MKKWQKLPFQKLPIWKVHKLRSLCFEMFIPRKTADSIDYFFLFRFLFHHSFTPSYCGNNADLTVG